MFHYFLKRRLKQHDANNNRKLQAMMHSALLQQQTLERTDSGVGNSCEHDIVVSLTSFEKRIDDLYLCIESLFQQSIRADRIVLWLSTDNFPGKSLPELLQRQVRRGLQVFFVDENLGPYKKYVYSFAKFPDSLIITVDDDVLYPPDMIEMLYKAYLRDPTNIYCHRAHRIQLKGSSKLAPYRKWQSGIIDCQPSRLVFPTGTGGVLYFPGSLHEDAFNSDKFMRLCPNADDIWLKAMSLKNGVLSAKIDDPRYWKDRFLTIAGSQSHALKRKNWHRSSGNDQKMHDVFTEYDLFRELS